MGQMQWDMKRWQYLSHYISSDNTGRLALHWRPNIRISLRQCSQWHLRRTNTSTWDPIPFYETRQSSIINYIYLQALSNYLAVWWLSVGHVQCAWEIVLVVLREIFTVFFSTQRESVATQSLTGGNEYWDFQSHIWGHNKNKTNPGARVQQFKFEIFSCPSVAP